MSQPRVFPDPLHGRQWPFARGSVAGDSIYKKFIADSREDERKLILAESILREFNHRVEKLLNDGPAAFIFHRVSL